MTDTTFRGAFPAPFRQQFDAARDPYSARNALGITSIGGGGAPTTAEYITAATDATLTNERVLTDTATVTWDFTTAGQAKANATSAGGVPTTRIITAGAGLTGGGDLSADRILDVGAGTGITVNANDVALTVPVSVANGGTGSTTAGGALTSLGAQPLDATLTALAAYNTNGLLTQTAADTFTGRTLTGPAAGITVSNGNGVPGNPTLALANDLAALEALAGTNTIYYRSAADTWTAVTIGGNLTFSAGTLNATTDAPTNAEYIVSSSNATLTAERVLTNTASITWDFSTPGQAKASTAAGGGNVSNSGTPAAGQVAEWVTSTTIAGVSTYAKLASPTFTGDPKAPTPAVGDNDTSIATTAFVTAAVLAATPTPPQGRLTLASATPVMTTSQTAKTTLYYTPMVGRLVPIYDGANFTMTSIGSEISVATTDTSKSPAAIGANKINDWFVWNDAGTVRLGHGPDWTNATTRSAGTALTRVQGIWLNNASITNGPAASRGTYVGTTYSDTSSKLDWQLAGSNQFGTLGVWNCYNRRLITTQFFEPTASWTYTTATWRVANGNTANAYVEVVIGLQEDACDVAYHAMGSNGGAAFYVGVGYDGSANPAGIYCIGGFGNNYAPMVARHCDTFLGFHYWFALESGNGSSASSFYGTSGVSYKTGLIFKGWM